ncbi:hypothetical protein IFT84_01965 [Rhizobium sp. CFBP 8762]|uniref:COG4315 family predicted lipoprotein n=1 Tax=Rhizobium sp. CFBP 8762 TaxID=2775279 RepID=UPI00177D629B|nr:hypothetical protein [Rhizobium sp. CFBP 8762]MBD8553283.1 hypothetical protein [Rhizobium sp. CFBP 8762]
MKLIFITGALVTLMTMGAFAAEPAKMMDTQAGRVFADSKGMTLYTFDKDMKGKSACAADCMKKWPPFMAGSMAKPSGDWSVVKSTAGTDMWAYKGKPVYTFAMDKKPGDAKGEGMGGVWHMVK